MSFFDSFTGLYETSKTLRYELKPVGRTKELVEDYLNGEGDSLIAEDEARTVAKVEVMDILDNYYRDFISAVLSDMKLDGLDELYALYKAMTSNDKNAAEAYKKQASAMKKIIAKAFSDKMPEYGLDKMSSLWGTKTKIGLLYLWLACKLNEKLISEEEYLVQKQHIDSFRGYTVYFINYKTARDNLFAMEGRGTSIVVRIVDENLTRHFRNCLKIEDIKLNFPDLYSTLDVSAFEPESFARHLSQEGIDTYNRYVGGTSENKGANIMISEYKSKNGLGYGDISKLEPLYKQMLSGGSEEFIRTLKTDKEMLELASDTIQTARKAAVECHALLTGYLSSGDLSKIFIRADKVTDISSALFGAWNAIPNALEDLNADNKKSKVISMSLLQEAIVLAAQNADKKEIPSIVSYFLSLDCYEALKKSHAKAMEVLSLDVLNKDRRVPDAEHIEGGIGYRQISKIKSVMDAVINLSRFYKPFYLNFKGLNIDELDIDMSAYSEFITAYQKINVLFNNYNLIRNYATKKPYSREQFKLNFGNMQLLVGWDINSMNVAKSALLERNGKYYLAIFPPAEKKMFSDRADYAVGPEESGQYRLMIYKQMTGAFMSLPKVFFSKRGEELYQPSDEIMRIYKNGTFKKGAGEKSDLYKMIDFYKMSIAKHPEWSSYFTFRFKPTEEYSDISEFYRDVDNCTFSVKFEQISGSYVDEMVEDKRMFLFEIYCQKFSDKSNGRLKLHQLYFKEIFDERNISAIDGSDGTYFKLCGGSEIFFRKKSLTPDRPTHPAGVPMKNKNPLNPRKTRTLPYDLIKDKRFTVDKIFLHVPFTANVRSAGLTRGLNMHFNKAVRYNNELNIIGLSRGERHLLYYVIINKDGHIIKHGSFNTITSTDGKVTDYRRLLEEKEERRDAARKDWGTIEGISDLKAGYLSNVVHQITKLMIENNAVVALENLDTGFKDARCKIEKSIYQQFEKALISKLGFLAFKDNKPGEVGSVARAYQLSAPFEGFNHIFGQTGAVYYVNPAYVTTIDPLTGFTPFIKAWYKNVKQAQEFFKKFKCIRFDSALDHFEFYADSDKFTDKETGRSSWTITTHGDVRHRFNSQLKKYEIVNVTARLKDIFTGKGIGYADGEDIRAAICQVGDATFYKDVFFCLQVLLLMRYYSYEEGREAEYLVSPVMAPDGTFFDTRTAGDDLPQNLSANSAFHIALKAKSMIETINDDGKIDLKSGKNWISYVQGHLNRI